MSDAARVVRDRFLQRHEFISCPDEPKLLFVELASEETAKLAAQRGLAEGLGTRKGKGKGKMLLSLKDDGLLRTLKAGERETATHADFILSSKLERRNVPKHGKCIHLALCRVQCGRVYDMGKPHHTRRQDLPDGFDSAYDDQQCSYRLIRANTQLALPLFTVEVLVKIRQSMAEVPLYWSPDVASPFGLVKVTSAERAALKDALRPGGTLGGRDQREDGDYSGFRLKEAWRVEHPGLWGKYAAEKQNMKSQLETLQQTLPSPRLRGAMAQAASSLPAELDDTLNEVQLGMDLVTMEIMAVV
eukprot:Skav232683  [mRNA]  locus=scaffold698:438530:440681:+ [translate_table: standard]